MQPRAGYVGATPAGRKKGGSAVPGQQGSARNLVRCWSARQKCPAAVCRPAGLAAATALSVIQATPPSTRCSQEAQGAGQRSRAAGGVGGVFRVSSWTPLCLRVCLLVLRWPLGSSAACRRKACALSAAAAGARAHTLGTVSHHSAEHRLLPLPNPAGRRRRRRRRWWWTTRRCCRSRRGRRCERRSGTSRRTGSCSRRGQGEHHVGCQAWCLCDFERAGSCSRRGRAAHRFGWQGRCVHVGEGRELLSLLLLPGVGLPLLGRLGCSPVRAPLSATVHLPHKQRLFLAPQVAGGQRSGAPAAVACGARPPAGAEACHAQAQVSWWLVCSGLLGCLPCLLWSQPAAQYPWLQACLLI